MTEEEFIYGPENVREYVKSVKDKDEEKEIGWEIRRRKGFIKRLSPEVKKMFLDNYEANVPQDEYFFQSNDYPDSFHYDTKKTIYYVYEYYTCDDNKVCYVGYSCIPNFTYSSTRDKRVVMLREKKGLAMRILIDNLTEFQSEVYSTSYKTECIKRGEFLLNYESSRSLDNLDREIIHSNGNPFVYKDSFIKHYFKEEYYENHGFDNVTSDSLKCTYFLQNQNREIVEWLREKNARIMRTVTKTVNSIIVGPYITYYDYIKYRRENKRIISENDVLDYINNNPEHPLFYNSRKCSKAGKKDIEKRDYIRKYLNDNSNVLEEYFQYMRNKKYPIRDLQEPFSTIILQGIKPIEKYNADIRYLLMWKASGLQDGNMDRLTDIYIQYGMYEEALPLLEKNDNRAADYYYYKEQIEM